MKVNLKKRRAYRAFLLIFVTFLSISFGSELAMRESQEESVQVLMKYGSQGADVRVLQEKLSALGYNTGGIDGIYGSKTKAAVLAYQRSAGLQADGIAGQNTLGSLGLSEGGGSSGSSGNRENDLKLLAQLISAESRGESFEGQVAVGAVVMNRIKHPTFPNTVAGVIYQSGAFSSLNDGQFYQPVAESSRRAAENVMNGMDNTGGAIYFYNPAKTSNQWMLARPVLRVIGNHRFCS